MVYIHRNVEDEIVKFLDSKEMIAVFGTRQCGKTTMLNHLLDSIEVNNKINRISFDNIKEKQLFEEDIDSFIDLHVIGYDYLFIDEVQYSKNSGRKLKYIYDAHDVKIVISGSSAAELSIQSLKYLVGRIFIFVLYPFSFGEFLRARNPKLEKLYERGDYGSQILSRLNKLLDDFILYGGYPRVVLSNDNLKKKKILENIYSIYLLKEIRDIMGLSEDYMFTKLLKGLSLQIGGLINYSELSQITGLSHIKLKKFLNILEKTFVCSRVMPFFTNKRTELVKNPKIYFFDTGFRNVCINNFSSDRSDKGSLYENFIFSEIVKQGLDCNYWRTKSHAEVDFILDNKIPIEVKSNSAKVTK